MKQNLIFVALAWLAYSCAGKAPATSKAEVLAVPYAQVTPANYSTPITLGGYGSAVAYDTEDSIFYMLTDRGPNVDATEGEGKIFPMTDFTPTIGAFRYEDDGLTLIRKIELRGLDGKRLTGLPNEQGDGVTGEIAYDTEGNHIANTRFGVDTEGLALAPDGTFWISDEYAPFVMQFNAEGLMLRRFAPGSGLPNHFAKRRPNRGMEGLTISRDGTKLYGIMQSPLYLPDITTKGTSRNNRILEIDLKSGKTREFIYQLESADLVCSDILWVGTDELYVLERDGKFPKDGKGAKMIYKVDISRATDVSDIVMEKHTDEQLASESIEVARKSIAIDILKAIPSFPHDKAEGLTLFDANTLVITNDDDFGVDDAGNGSYCLKLNRAGEVDRNMLYFVER